MFSPRGFFAGAFVILAPQFIAAQAVVSVHSGVVHFFEGSVSIDGQPLEPKFGKFYNIATGSELRTEDGRVEVLLTPGVLLRVDQNSSVRMLSNKLSDTRVEFIGGSAALDSMHAEPGPPITILYRQYSMRFNKPGQYRLDSAPPGLRVHEGQAEVSLKSRSVSVESGEQLPFSPALAKFIEKTQPHDGLDDWTTQRDATVAANNASAAAVDDLTNQLNTAQAYDYGVGYGTLTPGVYVSNPALYPGGLYRPYSLYSTPGLGLGYGYAPFYLGLPAYRQITPVHSGTYRPPTTWHPIGRSGVGPSMRAPATSAAPRPVPRAGHR